MSQRGGYLHNALNIVFSHIGAIIAVFFWALSFVSTKIIMERGHLSPTEAYMYRFVIAYIIVLFISHKKIFCNNWRDEMLMLLCGVTSGSVYFITENTALQYTLTSNVSLLTSTSPLITILLVSMMYRNQRPGRGIVIGSLIAFAGVVCVIFNSFNSQEEFAINPLGDLLALSSAVCWSLYSLVLKRLNVTYDTMFITRKTFFYGLVTAIPFLLFEPHLLNPIEVLSDPLVLGNLLFLAFGASIISYYLWAVTIKRVGAVKANNYMYFQPIITLIASALILHEPIRTFGIIGFFLILFGLWFGDYLQARKLTARS